MRHFLAGRFLPAWFLYLFALPHELFHYGMARVLGVPVRIVPGKVVFQKTDRWRKAFILLAPAVGGFLLLLLPDGGIRYWLTVPDGLFWLLAWWVGCACDLVDLLRLVLEGV